MAINSLIKPSIAPPSERPATIPSSGIHSTLKSFDGRGNYCFGITEQGVFPEINMASVKFTHGMNINLVFRNSTDERSQFVLREIGLPFERDEDQ